MISKKIDNTLFSVPTWCPNRLDRTFLTICDNRDDCIRQDNIEKLLLMILEAFFISWEGVCLATDKMVTILFGGAIDDMPKGINPQSQHFPTFSNDLCEKCGLTR
jgi:hypothetical protein